MSSHGCLTSHEAISALVRLARASGCSPEGRNEQIGHLAPHHLRYLPVTMGEQVKVKAQEAVKPVDTGQDHVHEQTQLIGKTA